MAVREGLLQLKRTLASYVFSAYHESSTLKRSMPCLKQPLWQEYIAFIGSMGNAGRRRMVETELREMTGAELQSLLKSSIQFKSLQGVTAPGLRLSEEQMAPWRNLKFGMFIHWGLYSIPGRGEWVMQSEGIPAQEYARLADDLKPEHFDADAWAQLARDAGMRYMVMVARHHDGFALWNSPGSWKGFDSVRTGAKRDYVKEYVEACRKADLKVGLYYSPMDWRFPAYFDPHGLPENAQELKKQCWDQVEELTTQYGPIDILWYDGGWLAHSGTDAGGAWLWDSVALNRAVRERNPLTVINPRSGWEGDFQCDEGQHEISGDIIPIPWEKCLCVCSGRSWGWIPNDPPMPFADLVRMLVNVFVRDGNVLLNVGPDKDGVIPPEAADRLREVGAWMNRNGESIYDTRGGPFQPVDGVYGSTCREDRIYLHVLDADAFSRMTLPSLAKKVLRVWPLGNEQAQVSFTQNEEGIQLHIPSGMCDPIDTILVLETGL